LLTCGNESANHQNTGAGGTPGTERSSDQVSGSPSTELQGTHTADSTLGQNDATPAVPESGGAADEILYVGNILITETAQGQVSIDAGFIRFSRAVRMSQLVEALAKPDDSCVIQRWDADGKPVETTTAHANPYGQVYEFVSAGEQLFLESSAGPLASLHKQQAQNITAYSTGEHTLSGPLPRSATLRVPGDDFPAFSDVLLSQMEPVQLTAPGPDDSLTPSSVLTWLASDDSQARVGFIIEFMDGDTSPPVSVSCSALDDGEFSLPEATQQQLKPAFSSATLLAGRDNEQRVRRGNALLVIQHQRSY